MCSCDTSSGRTVSAQRQAAFSSCSRGAMALAQEARLKPGRRRLRCRPNELRHLPAKRTKCSLSQMASQSPVRATAAAPARAQPARLAAKRSRRHPTPPAPTDVDGVLPAAGGACAFPAAPAPPAPLTGRAAERGEAVQDSAATSSPPQRGKLRLNPQGSVLRTTILTSPRPWGRRLSVLASGTSPLTVDSHARLLNAHHRSSWIAGRALSTAETGSPKEPGSPLWRKI